MPKYQFMPRIEYYRTIKKLNLESWIPLEVKMDEAVRSRTFCNLDPNLSLVWRGWYRPSWSHATRSRLCTVLSIRVKSVLLILSGYLLLFLCQYCDWTVSLT